VAICVIRHSQSRYRGVVVALTQVIAGTAGLGYRWRASGSSVTGGGAPRRFLGSGANQLFVDEFFCTKAAELTAEA
jgi:hypothetical protein